MKKNVANLVLKSSQVGWILLIVSGILYILNVPGYEFIVVSAGVVFIFRQILILAFDSPTEIIDLSIQSKELSNNKDINY